MKKEEIISYKTAKLAKEKGFNGFCMFYYEKSTESLKPVFNGNYHIDEQDPDNLHFGFDMNIQSNSYYSAPTQSLLQKYLREKHGIEVFIDLDLNTEYFVVCKSLEKGLLFESKDTYKTYEEALEKGLQEALKLIKDE